MAKFLVMLLRSFGREAAIMILRRALELLGAPMSWHTGNVLAKVAELLQNVDALVESLAEDQRGPLRSLLQAARSSHAELSALYSSDDSSDDVRS